MRQDRFTLSPADRGGERPCHFLVTSFGGLQILRPDGLVAPLHLQRARALVVLLLINRENGLHRDIVCNHLWPELDEPGSRSQLRKTLWHVRRALDYEGSSAICVAESQIWLDCSQIEADCWQLSDIWDAIELKDDAELDKDEVQLLLEAISLNSGTFAAGLLDDWCIAHQEMMENTRIAAMERIIGYFQAQGNWLRAIHWAQKALMLDPAREDLHYTIMVCRNLLGDRTSALRQYRLCEKILQREFGWEPSPGLRDLRSQIANPSKSSDRVAVVPIERTA